LGSPFNYLNLLFYKNLILNVKRPPDDGLLERRIGKKNYLRTDPSMKIISWYYISLNELIIYKYLK